MSKSKMTRREFMGRSVAGAAATGVVLGAPAILSSASPNEQVTVGLIGAGIRGLELMQYALNAEARSWPSAISTMATSAAPRRFSPTRPPRATTGRFSRNDIHAVIVATSDHWHAPIAIAAMRAGKDVYCEKPMAHSIPEALDMVSVSRETGRLVQVGSQSLSMQSTRQGKQWLDSGESERVHGAVRDLQAGAIGAWKYPVPPDASPQTIDWDRYLGDAPKRPFDAPRFFQFRNWWDYGTGIAGDEYVHLLSRVHYLMNVQFRSARWPTAASISGPATAKSPISTTRCTTTANSRWRSG